jgi:hypothetical protein
LKPEVTRAVEVATASVESDRAVIAAARARRRASLARLDERARLVVVLDLHRVVKRGLAVCCAAPTPRRPAPTKLRHCRLGLL